MFTEEGYKKETKLYVPILLAQLTCLQVCGTTEL